MTILEARGEASEARMLTLESSTWVTRVAMKAQGVVTKVRWAATPVADTGEGGEARPSPPRRVSPALVRFTY